MITTQPLFNKSLALCLWLLLTPAAFASPYSALYIFGDSLSDTGNLFNATQAVTGQGYPPSPYEGGRFSNGQLWAEYLAPQLDLSYTLAHNFAWAGANTGEMGSLPIPQNLQQQIQSFSAAVQGNADPDALYIIWSGANDVLDIGQYNSESIQVAARTAANHILTAAHNLHALGARHFLLISVPDLSLTPRAEAQQRVTELKAATTQLNQAVALAVANSALPVVLFDVQQIFDLLYNTPAAFGFNNITESCYTEADGEVCNQPAQYFFWDDLHPTTRVHALLADRLAQSVLPNQYRLADNQLIIPWLQVQWADGRRENLTARLQFNPDSGRLQLSSSASMTPNGQLFAPAMYQPATDELMLSNVFFDGQYYRLHLRWQPPATPFHSDFFEVLAVQ